MVATGRKPELIAVVGPTASGKSALALKIAREFDGEIISADSRTVYKGMNIGTAKPSEADQSKVRLWGLDLVKPNERFTAHQFKKYANQAIEDIKKRRKLPIIVGGTGLYLDALLFNFEFRSDAEPELRKELEEKSTRELQEIISKKGYKIPLNSQNRRHLIRAVETKGKTASKHDEPLKNSYIIGLMPEDEVLKQSIKRRAEGLFAQGLSDEVKELVKNYGEDAIENSGGIAYRACLKLLKAEVSQEQATEIIKKEEWQYARRQRTWFRRNKFIQWYPAASSAYKAVSKLLNN